MKIFTIRILALLITLVLFSLCVSTTVYAQNSLTLERTPEQNVEHLISLPHGLRKLSPEDQVLLDQVIDDPAPYLTALQSIYATTDISRIQQPDEILQFERTLDLLGIMDSPEATNQLSEWYMTLDSASHDRGRNPEEINNILQSQRIILSALGNTKQEEVINSILDSLEQLDYASQISALNYIARSSFGDTRTISKLREYLSDNRSPLYQSQNVERTLNRIMIQR